MTQRAAGRILVIGAGPPGLALAGELALAGVPCRVLDTRTARGAEGRPALVHASTIELLARRGLVGTAGGHGHRPVVVRHHVTEPHGDPARAARPRVLSPSAVERRLRAWVRRMGVEIIPATEVSDLCQERGGVAVRIHGGAGDWEERAVYVVDCAGAHSTVPALAGIGFDGGGREVAGVLADVRLMRAPATDLTVRSGLGGVMLSALCADGWSRVACLGRNRRRADGPVSLDEVRAALRRLGGGELEPYACRWTARFRAGGRLAGCYRAGRVLLLGDTAHRNTLIGDGGLNIGIQDAFNLGWKLAAVVNGWAGEDLLDSYQAERRAVARRAVEATRLLCRVASSPLLVGTPVAWGLTRWLSRRGVRRSREALLGMAPRYLDGPRAAELCGSPLPDIELVLPDGRAARLDGLLRDGRFVLLDLGPLGASAAVAGRWPDRVRPVVADLAEPGALRGATVALVRPDGYVAWATDSATPATRAAECDRALRQWCGTPGRYVPHSAIARGNVVDFDRPDVAGEIDAVS